LVSRIITKNIGAAMIHVISTIHFMLVPDGFVCLGVDASPADLPTADPESSSAANSMDPTEIFVGTMGGDQLLGRGCVLLKSRSALRFELLPMNVQHS
jgi:hypothetical protein